MTHVTGYLAKYDIHGVNGRIFMPGCFESCDGAEIPIVKAGNSLFDQTLIGKGKIKLDEKGAYIEGDFDESLSDESDNPRSFGFYANFVERKDKEISNATIRSCSLLNIKNEIAPIISMELIKDE